MADVALRLVGAGVGFVASGFQPWGAAVGYAPAAPLEQPANTTQLEPVALRDRPVPCPS